MGDKVRFYELDGSTQELLMSLFNGLRFAQFGDIRCTMPESYKEDADNFSNMAIRSDDVWVTTFPRSGTTWTQELVWILMNDFDYDTALKIPLMSRYLFLEVDHLARLNFQESQETIDPALLKIIAETMPTYEAIAKAPAPRFIKTHLPFSLLPSNLLDTTKVVYVARDPRDVAVSFYHHNRLLMKYSGDFKIYWDLFVKGLVLFTPFFQHLKEAWAFRHHPNMLFIFYEDMVKDLPLSIKRIANFLGKEVSNEQIQRLCEHLDIKNFKNNESVNPSWLKKVGTPDGEDFVRKGKAGGWRDHFDDEMAAQAQNWMRENLAGSDLRFPGSC